MTSGSQYTRLTYLSVLSAESGDPFGDAETDSSLGARRGGGRLAYTLRMTDTATDNVACICTRGLSSCGSTAKAVGPGVINAHRLGTGIRAGVPGVTGAGVACILATCVSKAHALLVSQTSTVAGPKVGAYVGEPGAGVAEGSGESTLGVPGGEPDSREAPRSGLARPPRSRKPVASATSATMISVPTARSPARPWRCRDWLILPSSNEVT